MLLVPLSPSVTDASSIVMPGTGSSSLMRPVADVSASVALFGFDNVTVNVSLFSATASPTTATGIVVDVLPAVMVAVPEAVT